MANLKSLDLNVFVCYIDVCDDDELCNLAISLQVVRMIGYQAEQRIGTSAGPPDAPDEWEEGGFAV